MKVSQLRRASSPLNVFKQRSALILSVDDEPAVLYTRYRILQAAGYDVLNAVDGEHALQLFTDFPVDLVLLDYLMPGLNGTAVAQEMRLCKPEVHVILVSAVIPDEILALVDGVVEKGNGPLSLLETIREHLAPPAITRQSA